MTIFFEKRRWILNRKSINFRLIFGQKSLSKILQNSPSQNCFIYKALWFKKDKLQSNILRLMLCGMCYILCTTFPTRVSRILLITVTARMKYLPCTKFTIHNESTRVILSRPTLFRLCFDFTVLMNNTSQMFHQQIAKKEAASFGRCNSLTSYLELSIFPSGIGS